jgi:GT2 family glycosyltransferase
MEIRGKVSIMVLMHNKVDMTQTCLERLADAVDGLDHEVILLDNASTEDIRRLEEYERCFRKFTYFKSGENIPFSKVNNLGARQASGRWLLFLNNDVFVGRESIRQLLSPLSENPHIGVTGGKLLYPGDISVQHAGIGQMLWDHPSNYGVMARFDDPRVCRTSDRFALSGAMLCFPRDVFEMIGGFDERYIWGTEDIDICLKTRVGGYKVLYCPEAVGTHVESATIKITRLWEAEANCKLYRRLWDHMLVPAEQQYVRRMKQEGIRCVAVFGMGTAARGLARMLDESGISIAAFTSSGTQATGEEFLCRPVIPLALLREIKFDRLMVASQFYFEMEEAIRDLDPRNEPIYPLLN